MAEPRESRKEGNNIYDSRERIVKAVPTLDSAATVKASRRANFRRGTPRLCARSMAVQPSINNYRRDAAAALSKAAYEPRVIIPSEPSRVRVVRLTRRDAELPAAGIHICRD